MLDNFDFNKRYVFDRDRYLEDEKRDDSITAKDMYHFNKDVKKWVDDLHGEEVKLISDAVGTVSMYKDIYISVNWCKELEE